MRLNQFEFLVALNKYRSFSKVSKVLLISQPSISRAIKELEEEVGYIILKREKNGIEFTAMGNLLLEKAVNIMEEINSIHNIKPTLESDLQWEVHVGTSAHICSLVMLDVLMALKEKHPKLSIKLIKSDISDVIKDVSANELDLGFIQINTIDEGYFLTEFENNALTFVEVFNEEMCFIVRPDHPLADKKNVKMSEILQFTFVTAKKTSVELLLNFFRKYGYDKEIIKINDIGTLRKFVEKSNAISFISKSAALRSNKIFQDKLVILSISDFKLRSKMGCIHNKSTLSSKEEIIIKELTDSCRKS